MLQYKAEQIRAFAKYYNIADEFIDAWGNKTEIPASAQLSVLRALGVDAHLDTMEPHDVSELPETHPGVLVVQQQLPIQFRLTLPSELSTARWILTTEDGTSSTGELTLTQPKKITIGKQKFVQYVCTLQPITQSGYHELGVDVGVGEQSLKITLIVTPSRCFHPHPQAKIWGISTQLYSLRRENDQGIGDFTALQMLIHEAAAKGADYIGINPIHLNYRFEHDVSPYSPSSRKQLNWIYLDITRVPGAQNLELSAIESKPEVDYIAVYEAKKSNLYQAFLQFEVRPPEEQVKKAFDAYLKHEGEHLHQASIFEALVEHFFDTGHDYVGWQSFPEEYQQVDAEAVITFAKQNAKRVRFFQFLQWQTEEQLSACHEFAKQVGMKVGLYQDLAVGCHRGGFDTWSNPACYLMTASAGAPPDLMNLKGQNWGLPPFHPMTLKQQGYAPFIQLLRKSMRHAGALRIDHVLGLLRIWCVPEAESAAEGAYLHYPIDDLFGIIALESHRYQCQIIGEDLGVVPDQMREKMKQYGLLSYRVFFFEKQDETYIPPQEYPQNSMAVLATHDLPTIAGFWSGEDLIQRKSIGLFPTEDVYQAQLQQRYQEKIQLQTMLELPQGSDAFSKVVNCALHQHLATCRSHMVTVQLEDLVGQTKAVNIPGTWKEYPNWRLRMTKTVSEIFQETSVHQLTTAVQQTRLSVQHSLMKEPNYE
ncbi:4-alpha-glucanotransferase [Algicola sagamiensis]|uniref:4-alpha-glucanotransferase n=1 Tax=Algicola sagamiensis TaxID=163869 RepID=UPI00146DAE97|nr:4-alpha-glucanotransferase [Algicola sagamiensis]